MEIKPEYVFIGIVLLVPAQYFLSAGHIKYNLNSLVSGFKPYIPTWLSPIDADEEAAQNEKMSAEMDGEGNGAYGFGQYVRRRSPQVEFRVGDVVEHTIHEFRAVIIGWDETARAPERFIKVQHGERTEMLARPHYVMLVDTRDYLTAQMTYAVQDNLRIVKGTVFHPNLHKFFEGFDEKRQKYIMRPINKIWYPDD